MLLSEDRQLQYTFSIISIHKPIKTLPKYNVQKFIYIPDIAICFTPSLSIFFSTFTISSSSTWVINLPSNSNPPLTKYHPPSTTSLKSGGKLQNGGSDCDETPHNRMQATFSNPVRLITAFMKCVVPMLTLVTSLMPTLESSLLAAFLVKAFSIADTTPEVMFSVVEDLLQPMTWCPCRIATSVLVPPTSTPMTVLVVLVVEVATGFDIVVVLLDY